MRKVWLIAAVCAILTLLIVNAEHAGAAGKKRPVAPSEPELSGKRVIELPPIRNVEIEMPDQQKHDFGADFQAALTGKLVKSGRFVVADPPIGIGPNPDKPMGASEVPDYVWSSSVTPAATVQVKVEALSFQTGKRGDRMFYGFNERFRTEFNAGYDSPPNEFPLRKVKFEPNWYDRQFEERGSGLTGSHSGLDLGDGFKIDVLFAWLAVKYAFYHSELRLRLDINAPLAGRQEYRMVQVQGDGYFYDIAGAYMGYSAGIQVARRDAMEQAFRRALAGAYDALDRAVADLPLTGRIDGVSFDGSILLGSGHSADVKPGVVYESVLDPRLTLVVDKSTSSGAITHLTPGLPKEVISLLQLGMVFREQREHNLPVLRDQPLGAMDIGNIIGGLPAAIESVDLPWVNLKKADLTGLAPYVSWWTAFWRSIAELIFLPYRISRYMAYDQTYHKDADSVPPTLIGDNSESSHASTWQSQIGLRGASAMAQESTPVVAIIDSGMDYNHPALHDQLWLNPAPVDFGWGFTARKDLYGWDFISGDPHPFDDGYHGTEVASLIAAVAPKARLMPLKIFNPWGITTSAAILGAFQYAVDHGAQVIVCAWATRVHSSAIEKGVAYAQSRGIPVIAAAGDRGDVLTQVPAYPAALASKYDNVLAVTSVDEDDELVKVSGHYANSDPLLVRLAAPGQSLWVASPRRAWVKDTSTSLATALAAGSMARDMARDARPSASPATSWIRELILHSDVVPALGSAVAGGRTLRLE